MRKFLFAVAAVFPFFSCSVPGRMTSDIEIKSLVSSLWKTSCTEITSDRLWAMNRLQTYMDSLSNDRFEAYVSETDSAVRREMEDGTVLWYYQASLEKLLCEIPQTKVEEGSIVMWLLYNMGYVVKTPSHCFAVDIKHPEASRLVPHLDFLMITHDHNDHYTDAMNVAMTAAGKPVYSNFDSPACSLTNIRDVRRIDLGDISITTEMADHSKKYPQGFVATYLVDCGEDTGHTTIYFVGDSCYADQLNPAGHVDIFVPHLQVGLKIDVAAAKIQPECVLVSHLLELGHSVDRFRWTYWLGLDVAHQIHRQNCYVPVWGEKFVYSRGK